MKNLLTVLTFFFLQNTLVAQAEFAPEGAEWCYSITGGGYPFIGYRHIEYTKDTIIANKTSKVFDVISVKAPGGIENCCDTLYSKLFVYQSGDSIFITKQDSFEFMFRNAIPVGDTVEFPFLDDGIYVCDSIELASVSNSGMYESHLRSLTNPQFRTFILDRAGPRLGFYNLWFPPVIDLPHTWFSWYQDNQGAYAPYGIQSCDFLLTSTNSRESGSYISAIPNPVTDILYLNLPETALQKGELIIFGAAGNKVMSRQVAGREVELDVSGLAPGLYFGLLKGDGGNAYLKFVKN